MGIKPWRYFRKNCTAVCKLCIRYAEIIRLKCAEIIKLKYAEMIRLDFVYK